MAASQRRLSHPEPSAQASYDLRLVPLPVEVARLMLAGMLHAKRLGTASVEQRPPWHSEYPLPDSIDAIAMLFASHRAMLGAVNESPIWWIHQMIADGVVVGDIGFHGPPGPELTVEIATAGPRLRGRG